MAKKKSKRKKKKSPKKRHLKPFLWTIFFGFILTTTFVATGYLIFLTPGTKPNTTLQEQDAEQSAYRPVRPTQHEEYTGDAVNLEPTQLKHKPNKKNAGPTPRIAILIDDMGNNHKIGKEMIDLDMGLSFAFLPFTPHTQDLMNLASAHNYDILLHLPMEATANKWDPGPGTITTGMSQNAIILQVLKNLLDVPKAIGVNNHMGSKFTSDKASMQAALAPIKKRHLFFLDSMTSSTSIAYETARELGIKTGRRDIFLDNDQNSAKIKAQLQKLIKRAKKNGTAIGIGHPYPATLATLKKEEWWLKNQVDIVRISELMGN